MRMVVGAAAIVAAFVLAPAVGAGTTPPTLRADIAEWSVVPGSGVVPAGRVKLVVRNVGHRAHELIVVRTSSFGQTLALSGDRAVATPAAPRLVLAPGATRTILVSLTRGSYLLVDNLPWHYWEGTSAAFSVR
jgi:uncharacterized cupredoxin-like copper-binding protein